MFPSDLVDEARQLLDTMRERGLMLVTAESCTGGLISALLTEIPGSSDVVERGFVTYSNAAKASCLGIDPQVIEANGAVSEVVARAMAAGALANSEADIAVAVTGVAGPGGGSAEKPVGLVHFAAARRGQPLLHLERRFGDLGRTTIRLASVRTALDLVKAAIKLD
ncbi:MAG: damage-inducible protein CinA [Proteobacteria bacterium]|jgi:nicotinamide-nucleotide amidase|nr:MAG: damage-inducible protein CinA [Pseudomonadota bacterium]